MSHDFEHKYVGLVATIIGGAVLLLGVGSCLITSTMVLPNLLVAFGLVER